MRLFRIRRQHFSRLIRDRLHQNITDVSENVTTIKTFELS